MQSQARSTSLARPRSAARRCSCEPTESSRRCFTRRQTLETRVLRFGLLPPQRISTGRRRHSLLWLSVQSRKLSKKDYRYLGLISLAQLRAPSCVSSNFTVSAMPILGFSRWRPARTHALQGFAKTNKQTNKQTTNQPNNQPTNQTNNQPTKETNKHSLHPEG